MSWPNSIARAPLQGMQVPQPAPGYQVPLPANDNPPFRIPKPANDNGLQRPRPLRPPRGFRVPGFLTGFTIGYTIGLLIFQRPATPFEVIFPGGWEKLQDCGRPYNSIRRRGWSICNALWQTDSTHFYQGGPIAVLQTINHHITGPFPGDVQWLPSQEWRRVSGNAVPEVIPASDAVVRVVPYEIPVFSPDIWADAMPVDAVLPPLADPRLRGPEEQMFPQGRNSQEPGRVAPPQPPRPPRKNEKERKVKLSGIEKLISGVTETMDVVNAFYDTLPVWKKFQLRHQNGGFMSPIDKAQAVYDHLDLVDPHVALVNVLGMNKTDEFWALIGSGPLRGEGAPGFATGTWDTAFGEYLQEAGYPIDTGPKYGDDLGDAPWRLEFEVSS